MGRLMAKLLHRLEITKTDTLVEAQRGDLVATHIGQTAVKTRERIDEAKEGLLFVDEAYRLSGGGEKDFGKEAIEELMSAMLHPPGKAPVRSHAAVCLGQRLWLLPCNSCGWNAWARILSERPLLDGGAVPKRFSSPA